MQRHHLGGAAQCPAKQLHSGYLLPSSALCCAAISRLRGHWGTQRSLDQQHARLADSAECALHRACAWPVRSARGLLLAQMQRCAKRACPQSSAQEAAWSQHCLPAGDSPHHHRGDHSHSAGGRPECVCRGRPGTICAGLHSDWAVCAGQYPELVPERYYKLELVRCCAYAAHRPQEHLRALACAQEGVDFFFARGAGDEESLVLRDHFVHSRKDDQLRKVDPPSWAPARPRRCSRHAL